MKKLLCYVWCCAVLLPGGCDSRVGESCGGESNQSCGLGEYCQTASGACDAQGLCAQIPELCTLDFSPMCGCDGQTYSNECMAASAAVSVASEGQCQQDMVCCDPDEMPGVGGNPTCFEGASCCADGTWACNEAGTQPTCDELGQVCNAG